MDTGRTGEQTQTGATTSDATTKAQAKIPDVPILHASRMQLHALEYPEGAEVHWVFGATLKGQPKRWVWFRGTVKYRLVTPGKHGDLQLKISWHSLPKWGKNAEASDLELWDDRPFVNDPRHNSIRQNTR